MSIQLPKELQALVDRKASEEGYGTPDAVLAEALALLEARDRFQDTHREELRAELLDGIADLERGDYVLLDEAEVGRINAEGQAEFAKRKAQP